MKEPTFMGQMLPSNEHMYKYKFWPPEEINKEIDAWILKKFGESVKVIMRGIDIEIYKKDDTKNT